MSNNKDQKVDLSAIKQSSGVWLVKVPNYLSQQWRQSAGREVGKLNIGRTHGGRTEQVSFTLSKALSTVSAPGEKSETLQVPRDYPLTMHAVQSAQNLMVFSQSQTGGVALEGVVVQRGACRPAAANDNYMKLKKSFIAESVKPRRVAQMLETAVRTCKPVANHVVNVEYEKQRKAEGRMVRAERQVVLDMLFSALETRQCYNIKELVDITKQPVAYLKEIMREICVYNTMGAHKSMWELKPEYRTYTSSPVDMKTLQDSLVEDTAPLWT